MRPPSQYLFPLQHSQSTNHAQNSVQPTATPASHQLSAVIPSTTPRPTGVPIQPSTSSQSTTASRSVPAPSQSQQALVTSHVPQNSQGQTDASTKMLPPHPIQALASEDRTRPFRENEREVPVFSHERERERVSRPAKERMEKEKLRKEERERENKLLIETTMERERVSRAAREDRLQQQQDYESDTPAGNVRRRQYPSHRQEVSSIFLKIL